jgi:hypothetical protein
MNVVLRSSRGLLTANVALFWGLLQLRIPLGMDSGLRPGEHVLRRDAADGTVQADLVVMVDPARRQTARISVALSGTVAEVRRHSDSRTGYSGPRAILLFPESSGPFFPALIPGRYFAGPAEWGGSNRLSTVWVVHKPPFILSCNSARFVLGYVIARPGQPSMQVGGRRPPGMHKSTAARHRAPAPLFRETFRSRLGQNSFAMLTAMSTAI